MSLNDYRRYATETVESFIKSIRNNNGTELVYCGDDCYGRLFLYDKSVDDLLDLKRIYDCEFGERPRFTRRIKKADIALEILSGLDKLELYYDYVAKITGWKLKYKQPSR